MTFEPSANFQSGFGADASSQSRITFRANFATSVLCGGGRHTNQRRQWVGTLIIFEFFFFSEIGRGSEVKCIKTAYRQRQALGTKE